MRRVDARSHRHPAWWAYLVHRLSGLALGLFLPLHFWALAQALKGEDGLEGFLRFADQPLVKFAEWGLVLLLALHAAGGVRLLLAALRRFWFLLVRWLGLFLTWGLAGRDMAGGELLRVCPHPDRCGGLGVMAKFGIVSDDGLRLLWPALPLLAQALLRRRSR